MAAAHAQSLGKRGREGSTPTETEQWTRLARTVPATLLLVATSESERVIRRVESAHRQLVGQLCIPSHDSCGEVALHAGAGHVFAQWAARAQRAGLLADAPWRAWEGHRAEAARHGDEAAGRVRAALTHLAAAVQIILVVRSRPPESPPRVAWASEAERLARRAAAELAAALGAVRRMRDAVALEFFDAWAVLTNCEAPAN
ncbi:unnamed protein product [Urochloa humidicola]